MKTASQPNPALHAALSTAVLLFLLLFVLLAYTFSHEGGHALLGLLFGGSITSFDANFFNLSAHVGINGEFNSLQNSLISAAGAGLPLLLWAVLVSLLPARTTAVMGWFRLILSMGVLNSLLAWIIIPAVFLFNGQPVSDDSFNFLGTSGIAPLGVSAGALLVYLAGWGLLLRRSGGFRGLLARLRSTRIDLASPSERTFLLSLAGMGLILAAAAAGLSLSLGDRALDGPRGYQLVGSYDLSEHGYNDESVYEFTLDQPASLSFYFGLTGIQGAPLKIHLTGPDGYDNLFFQVSDPGFKAGQASVNPTQLALKAGTYQIRLTFPQGAGRIRLYAKGR